MPTRPSLLPLTLGITPALALALMGCGGPAAAGVDGGGDAGVEVVDARGIPTLDPALFDCTSLGPDGTRLPARASVVPIACGLDPLCRTPQIAGHRGAGGTLGRLAPEDTLSAYRAAIALGIEFVETDPRPTADGVIVNLHDTTVDRTTDGSGAVDQMTFEKLRTLKVDAARFPGDFSCDKVPTLREILETCRGRVVVLIDANKTDRVDLLVQAVREADALDWAVFDTSSVDKIDRALSMEPALRFMNRPSSIAAITTELDHFAPKVPVIVELEPSDVALGAPIVRMRGSRAFTDVFIEDAAAQTAGDLTLYGKAYDKGLDIVQTERPELVLELLRRRGLR